MATTIFINALNDIKNINPSFKILIKFKKKRIINKAIKAINEKYFNSNVFTASHIINFSRLFHCAKLMNILLDDDLIVDNTIISGGSKVNIAYNENSAVLRVKTDTHELIFTAAYDIKVECIDTRDQNHTYRLVYTYDEIYHDSKKPKMWEEVIRSHTYESLYVVFNLILQIVFNALYEKEN